MRKQPHYLPAIATGLALVLGLLPCRAQNAGEVKLRFLSFPKSIEPLKVELRLAEGKTVGVEAPSNEFSQPLSVVSTGVWSVGETVEGADGKPAFKEYGRATAPASTQQMLILVRKGDSNADGFDLIALDGKVDAFGGGKFLFLNAAKVDIAGVVGQEKFVVKPGSHTILKPKAEEGSQLAHAMFYFRKDDEPRAFFSSRWPVGDQARSMIFFYHDPESKHIRMHTVRDFL